jgi:hypothetical protein
MISYFKTKLKYNIVIPFKDNDVISVSLWRGCQSILDKKESLQKNSRRTKYMVHVSFFEVA